MMIRHPKKATLRDWLSGDLETNVAIDDHLETCQRCASALEEIDTDPERSIGDALAQALAPPPDLTQRLTDGVSARLSSRQVMDVVADLFGAGFETTRLLLIEDTDDND